MAMAALSPGTLVSISGLQSEAGKALNGGRGIVIGSPAKDSGRFPVLVYSCCVKQTGTSTCSASSSNTDKTDDDEQSQGKVLLEIVDDLSGLKRSMKEQNLTPLENQMCEIYQDYASMAWEYAYKTDNIRDALMHLEHYTKRWPEDYMCSITHANLIRDGISSSGPKTTKRWRQQFKAAESKDRPMPGASSNERNRTSIQRGSRSINSGMPCASPLAIPISHLKSHWTGRSK